VIWEIGGRGGLGSVGLVALGGLVVVSIVVEVMGEGAGGVCFLWLFWGRCRMRKAVYGCWIYACGIPLGFSQVGLASIYAKGTRK
jgi:hypothetical protein